MLVPNVPSCKRWTDEGQKDKIMKKQIMNIMVLVRIGHLDAFQGTEKILSLLDENTASVSTASIQSCDLHGVRDCNANEGTDELNEVVVDGTLEKITDDGNKCPNLDCENGKVITNGKTRDCSCCN